MNCGKKVRLKPMNMMSAAMRAHISGYMRPVIFGHQKVQPAEERRDHAADHDVVEMRDDEVGLGQMHVGARAPRPTGRSSPPMVNRPMKPSA